MDRHACLAVQSTHTHTHTHALIRSTRAKPPHARYKRNKKREKERRHVQGLLTNTRSRPSRRGEGAGVTVQVSFCFRNDARAGNRRKQKTRKVPAHLNNDEEKKKKRKKRFGRGKVINTFAIKAPNLEEGNTLPTPSPRASSPRLQADPRTSRGCASHRAASRQAASPNTFHLRCSNKSCRSRSPTQAHPRD